MLANHLRTPRSRVRLQDEDYEALSRPLGAATGHETASSGPVALILRSRTEQLQSLEAIHTGLAATAILAVLLGLGLSFAVARTIARPLAAITDVMPLIAFVTAYDEYAVRAFEVNAVDYLLKPVEKARLREALNRAQERIEHAEIVAEQSNRAGDAITTYESSVRASYLERIPVRRRDEIVIVPVSQIASIVAEGELLYLTTTRNERYAISYRLKDLETRLDPAHFIRLGRGTFANIDLITKVNVMPGGTHVALLSTGHKLQVSRLQSRIIRERLLKL